MCFVNAQLQQSLVAYRHNTAVKHVRAAEPFSTARQRKLPFTCDGSISQRRSTSQAEGLLAMMIAEHTSFLNVDKMS